MLTSRSGFTCCVEAGPALVPITIYLVAGGDGCVGVVGRVDMRVRELGTLMILGVLEPVTLLTLLWETERDGRDWKRRYTLELISRWRCHGCAIVFLVYRGVYLCDGERSPVYALALQGVLSSSFDDVWTQKLAQISIIGPVLIHSVRRRSHLTDHARTVFLQSDTHTLHYGYQ